LAVDAAALDGQSILGRSHSGSEERDDGTSGGRIEGGVEGQVFIEDRTLAGAASIRSKDGRRGWRNGQDEIRDRSDLGT